MGEHREARRSTRRAHQLTLRRRSRIAVHIRVCGRSFRATKFLWYRVPREVPSRARFQDFKSRGASLERRGRLG